MSISQKDTEFLRNIVRDFWIPAYLDILPPVEKESMKRHIEKGKVKEVIGSIPSWCLFRFLSEQGYTSRLITRKKQLWIKDCYGDVEPDVWYNELRLFIQKRIDRLELACGKFPDYCLETAIRHSCGGLLQYNDKDFLFSQIDSHVDFLTWQEDDESKDFDEPANGHEFEHHVMRKLEERGWNVRHTGKSGDQGADIIAERESKSYVIQCKFSTYPISNSAIQEAHAGRGFHRAKFAAVVTNSEFTRSAKQLAASLGVDLIHARDLGDL